MAENKDKQVVLFKTDKVQPFVGWADQKPRKNWTPKMEVVDEAASALEARLSEVYDDVHVAVLFNPNGCVWFGGQIYC